MSGLSKNDWHMYLNGKTPHYNFSYKNQNISEDIIHIPNTQPPAFSGENAKYKLNNKIRNNTSKKSNKYKIRNKYLGGKRNSKRK
jgi:hypothetical protein